MFPVGNFVTVLHAAELSYALTHGHIRQVLDVAIYRKGTIFKDYIDYFYNRKLAAETAGDRVSRHQAKILMNALYGKFGQREVVSKTVPNISDTPYGRVVGYSEALHQTVEVVALGTTMQVSYPGGESTYSSPAIAGAVTAYARMYLWSLIEMCGRENVYYMDTDSLMSTDRGLAALSAYLDPHKLGMLKDEGQADQVIIRGCKDYQFGAETKHKGVPKRAIESDPNTWVYQQPRGAKSWANEGFPTGAVWYTRTKTRRSAYDKGVVQIDGSVLPLRL